MKIAVITPKSVTGETGGAENLYKGLIKKIRERGYEVDQVEILVDESSFDKILEAYCKCFYLDLSNYDLVISTKAPTYMVRHPNHVSYLLHTIRVFYDMFSIEFDAKDEEKIKQRRLIHKLDKYGLDPLRVKRHFVNGSEVYKRMRKVDNFWNKINFQVLHHPPLIESFKEPEDGKFIFLPGRLHRWKRVDLVIKAMEYVTHNVKLIIAGKGEDEEKFKDLAKNDKRIEFLGNVSEERLIELYSKSIVVPFVPINEDYGLITIEAFKSKKPVITCNDSGEPTCIVKDGINGFIVEPNPKKIAEKINFFIENPEIAKKMGEVGFNSIKDITWDNVVNNLLGIYAETHKNFGNIQRNMLGTHKDNTSSDVIITYNHNEEKGILNIYRKMAQNIEGWFYPPNDFIWNYILSIQKGSNLLEVGCYKGKSALLSLLHTRPDEKHMLLDKKIQPELLDLIRSLRLTDRVEIFEGDSHISKEHKFYKYLYRWIHIDASHEYEDVLNDIKTYEPVLDENGILCLDDTFNHEWPGVTMALGRYIITYKEKLVILCTGFNKTYLCRPHSYQYYINHIENMITIGLKNNIPFKPRDTFIEGTRCICLGNY